MATSFCVDFDDLCDGVAQELEALDSIKTRYPGFKATLFTIPARTSARLIAECRSRDWLQLAPHGWRHTRGECLSWTDGEALDKIKLAKDMGIDAPIFRAPAWLLDGHVYQACKALDYVVASHRVYRIPSTGVREYIYNKRGAYRFRALHGHLTPVSGNYIRDMIKQGKFQLPDKAKYVWPQDVAEVFP